MIELGDGEVEIRKRGGGSKDLINHATHRADSR